jgi:hypothetical protein
MRVNWPVSWHLIIVVRVGHFDPIGRRPPTAYIVGFKMKGLYKIRTKVDSNDWIPF